MISLCLQLMHREALQRLEDAATLTEAWDFQEDSDSAYLLRLLGFELLLKLVIEAKLNEPAWGHKYDELFNKLPFDVQQRLICGAGERIGPSALATDHQAVLKQWGENFVAVRFPWEKYRGLSHAEYVAMGEAWVRRGAPLEEATLRYYPEELVGILAALLPLAEELLSEVAHGD